MDQLYTTAPANPATIAAMSSQPTTWYDHQSAHRHRRRRWNWASNWSRRAAWSIEIQRSGNEPAGTRTRDPVIKSHMLYQLSYRLCARRDRRI